MAANVSVKKTGSERIDATAQELSAKLANAFARVSGIDRQILKVQSQLEMPENFYTAGHRQKLSDLTVRRFTASERLAQLRGAYARLMEIAEEQVGRDIEMDMTPPKDPKHKKLVAETDEAAKELRVLLYGRVFDGRSV